MKYIYLLLTTLSFNLSAQVKDLPYLTGFDNAAEKEGWKEYRTGYQSTSRWQTGGTGFEGQGLSHDYNVGGQDDQVVLDWFVSPLLKFNGESIMKLKIFSAGFSVPFVDNLLVYFIENNQSPALGDTTVIGNLSDLEHFNFLDTSVVIPHLADEGYIAFKYKTKGAAWTTYVIDNIEITEATAEIDKPIFKGKVQVYPSISSETVTLELSDISSEKSFEIYDIQGQMIRKKEQIKFGKTIINKDALVSGIYFLKIQQSDGASSTVKIQFTE